MASPVTAITHAASASKTPAADAVLRIPELLELILAHLDIRSLTRCSQICQHWRSVIYGSTALQQILFLLPRRPIFNFTFIGGDSKKPYITRLSTDKTAPIVEGTPCGISWHEEKFNWRTDWAMSYFNWGSLRLCDDNMFLTQPPCVAAWIVIPVEPFPGALASEQIESKDARGLRIGKLKGCLKQYGLDNENAFESGIVPRGVAMAHYLNVRGAWDRGYAASETAAVERYWVPFYMTPPDA